MRRTPRPAGTVAARLLPIRIHAIAARVKSADGESVFAIKATTKSITITQAQTPRKRLPAKTKKNQAGTIDLQLSIRGRPRTPLKTKKQAIQTALRNNGSKCRRKKNASSVPATDT